MNVANESRLFRSEAVGQSPEGGDDEGPLVMKDGRRRSMIANIFARAVSTFCLVYLQ